MPEGNAPASRQTAASRDETQRVLRRVGWHILPLLILLYFVAFLDRINIGFAAASMQRDLHFSDSLYGTGAGLFFMGALLSMLPSNLLIDRLGARRVIAGLMIAWSIVSGSMAFLHSPVTFLVLRFLLGVAEAGFYPGVIFYLTLWLPRRVRSSYLAWFIFAVPMANIFGGPLSSWILTHGHIGRFANWQVLLLTEAAPAILLGSLLPWLMSDSPERARWLNSSDRALLLQARAEDEPPAPPGQASRRFDIGSPRHILLFAGIYFTMQFGIYAQSFWLPKILANMGVASRAIGWHIACVYLGAMAIMLAWALFADRAPTRRWTLAVPLLISAVGYAATSLSSHIAAGTLAIVVVMIAFGLGGAGELAATPPFWAQVTLGQRPTAVAGMIAVINALGNIGGFAGPSTLGWLQQHAGGYSAGMLSVGAAIMAGVVLLYVAHPQEA